MQAHLAIVSVHQRKLKSYWPFHQSLLHVLDSLLSTDDGVTLPDHVS